MSDTGRAGSHGIPPHVQLIQMGTAYLASRIVYSAAMLGLADQLASGPKSASELAEPLKAHAPSLHRFMRTLASLGILTERDGQRFALTSLGQAMRTGAPGCAKSTIIACNSSWFTGSIDNLIYSVQTGGTAFEKLLGLPIFDCLAKHPEEASLFSEAMVGFHGEEPPAVAAAYDFSVFKTIVDVGGATGNMLAAILSRHSGLRGILFDRPYVVSDAQELLKSKRVSDRVLIEPGDFFRNVPSGGDAYILSHIIHDWSEAQCLTILGHVRKAMKTDGRLLIVEMVLPSGDTPHPGKILDMVMLAAPGGQERTEDEYRLLLGKAGFCLTRVIPTGSPVSIVESTLS